MIIEWQTGAYTQYRNYYGIGAILNWSTGPAPIRKIIELTVSLYSRTLTASLYCRDLIVNLPARMLSTNLGGRDLTVNLNPQSETLKLRIKP